MAHQDEEHALEALQYLRTVVPSELLNAAVGIICGSGLGGLADSLLPHPQIAVAYGDIPHFANSTGDSLFCADTYFVYAHILST